MLETPTNEIAPGNTPSCRAETNRANAQNSTGPRPPDGKQRSSLNALRHGLTGQTVVLPSDDLAQTLAALSWRLNRAASIETNLLTLGGAMQSINVVADNEQVHTALAMAQAFGEQSQALANISIYEHRLSARF